MSGKARQEPPSASLTAEHSRADSVRLGLNVAALCEITAFGQQCDARDSVCKVCWLRQVLSQMEMDQKAQAGSQP